MTKNTVVFRADGNTQIGLGHIYRCIAIAEMLQEYFKCEFLLSSKSQFDNVIPSHYTIKHIPEEITLDDEYLWIKDNYDNNQLVFVLDGYQFKSGYQKNIKYLGIKLVYIDDLCEEHMFADAVINHSPVKNPAFYKKENYTMLYLGAEYVLLRQLFLNEAITAKNSFSGASEALITLGGSDEHNVTLKILIALLSIEQFKKINIVIGAAYKYKDSLTDVINSSTKEIKLFSNLTETEMLGLMRNSDVAFAPCSTTCLELIAVCKPIFVGFSASNQSSLYTYLKTNKLIFAIDDLKTINSDEIHQIVSKRIESSVGINKMLTLQKQLIDGKSGIRIKAIFKRLM